MTPRTRHALLTVFILSLFGVLWNSIAFFPGLEQATLDFRFAHFNRENRASSRVLVLDIDEESLKLLSPHYGRWPWPRRAFKDVVQFLAQGEPSGIYFDLLFTEAQQGTNDDRLLADATFESQRTSHAILLFGERSPNASPKPLPSVVQERVGFRWKEESSPVLPTLPLLSELALPVSPLLERAPSLHVVTTEIDPSGGVYRRIPPAFSFGGAWLPSLALQAVRRTLVNPEFSIHDQILELRDPQQTGYTIPVESDGRLRVNYYRLDRGPEIVSLAAVLQSASDLQSGRITDPAQLKLNPLDLQGKIILIGASAAGLADLKATPISPALPGVLIHATAISNILEADYLQTPGPFLQTAFTFGIIALVVASVLLLPNLALRIGVPLFSMAGYLGITVLVFQKFSWWLEIARPLTLGGLALLEGLATLVFVEQREKQKIRATLSRYLPPALAEQLVATGQDPHAEVGKRKELSILFSDIRGFTTLSEATPPEQLVSVLNQYLGRMTSTVFDNLGTLDKFIGDAVMAFWGAPIDDAHHAARALRTALEMRRQLQVLNQEWASRGLPPLAIGIGINTGEVIVGNIGSDQRLDYTVIGDNVNLASRLEGLTKQYHLDLIIGEGTEKQVREEFVCRPIDQVKVKGKNQPLTIYEPLCERTSPEVASALALAQQTERAFEAYRSGNFQEARHLYTEIKTTRPEGDGVSEVFIERCEELLASPPAEWDGVFVAKSK